MQNVVDDYVSLLYLKRFREERCKSPIKCSKKSEQFKVLYRHAFWGFIRKHKFKLCSRFVDGVKGVACDSFCIKGKPPSIACKYRLWGKYVGVSVVFGYYDGREFESMVTDTLSKITYNEAMQRLEKLAKSVFHKLKIDSTYYDRLTVLPFKAVKNKYDVFPKLCGEDWIRHNAKRFRVALMLELRLLKDKALDIYCVDDKTIEFIYDSVIAYLQKTTDAEELMVHNNDPSVWLDMFVDDLLR
jgi:hypothetical protein